MIDFIVNNLSTIIISLVLIAIVAAIIVVLVKNKKQGKTSCSCGCKTVRCAENVTNTDYSRSFKSAIGS